MALKVIEFGKGYLVVDKIVLFWYDEEADRTFVRTTDMSRDIASYSAIGDHTREIISALGR